MTTPAVTAIVLAYNIEQDLPRCLDSLLNQNFPDLELIVVDDGSTDRSGDIGEAYAARDSRIRVVHKENGGIGDARNAGMAAARGEYLCFIDGDDILLPGSLPKLWDLIQAYHPDILRYGFQKRYPDRDPELRIHPYPAGLYRQPALRAMQLDAICREHVLDYSTRRVSSACCNLFSRNLLEEAGLTFRSEREILNEDYLFMVGAMWAAKTVYFLPEGLYGYLFRSDSITRTPRKEMYTRKKKLFACYQQLLPGDDREISQRLDNFYIDCMYNCITEACQTQTPGEGIAAIRTVLADRQLHACLKSSRNRTVGLKPRCICLFMRLRLAGTMYWLYRLMT